MVRGQLKNIFLSASIPLPQRNPKYFDSADVIAIRDAVIALVTTVLPMYRLIWGGHPSITPLVNYVVQKKKWNVQEHVLLYQSKFFEKNYPEDNNQFENVIQTPVHGNRDSSLRHMRETMFRDHEYTAGIFVGGMEGVEKEFDLFKELQPEAKLIVLANTGAAAKLIYDNQPNKDDRLLNDYAFSSIFQEYLIDNL